MFESPEFWVGVAFVIFVALVYRPISAKLAAALDDRAAKIKAELDEAVRLREEAQALLARYQRQQNDAVKEAEEIITQARETSEAFATQAAKSLEELLKRREIQVTDRIARAEQEAVAEVRARAVDLAIGATRRLLVGTLDDKARAASVDAAIGDLATKLH